MFCWTVAPESRAPRYRPSRAVTSKMSHAEGSESPTAEAGGSPAAQPVPIATPIIAVDEGVAPNF